MFSWREVTPRRVNRYIDWEERRRNPDKSGAQTDWCFVAIRLKHGTAEFEAETDPADEEQSFSKTLTTLSIGTADFTPSMKVAFDTSEAEQLQQLNTRVNDIKDPEKTRDPVAAFEKLFSDPTSLEFYAYMQEVQIYTDDDEKSHVRFREHPEFEILFAGPPILGLRFQDQVLSRSIPVPPNDNKGGDSPVAIGIIDDGIAFLNKRFQSFDENNGRYFTRIEGLWLQDTEGEQGTGESQVRIGTQYFADQLNTLLNSNSTDTASINELAAYKEAGALNFGDNYRPTIGRSSTHGAHIMDLATGYAPENPKGVSRPIFAVQLPTAVTQETSGQRLPYYALRALKEIITWADRYKSDMPLVVNFSYGFQAGPKDGSSEFEWEIEKLLRKRRRFAKTEIVFPAGNSYDDRTAAQLLLRPNEPEDLFWTIQPDDRTDSFIEIWLPRDTYEDGALSFELELISPDGVSAGSIQIENSGDAWDLIEGSTSATTEKIASIYYDETKPASDWTDAAGNSADNLVRPRLLIAMNPSNVANFQHQTVKPTMSGSWLIRLTNLSSSEIDAELHVQRDDTLSGFLPGGRQSYLDHVNGYERNSRGEYIKLGSDAENDRPEKVCPVSPVNSLSAISTGHSSIIVSAADTKIAPTIEHANTTKDIEPNDSDFQWPASDYSAQGKPPNISGPNASAIADQGELFPGIYASGVLSSSSALLNGTSVAAPQITRALADHGGDWNSLQNAIGLAEPQAPTQKHSRLGSFALNGEHMMDSSIPHSKRRYYD